MEVNRLSLTDTEGESGVVEIQLMSLRMQSGWISNRSVRLTNKFSTVSWLQNSRTLRNWRSKEISPLPAFSFSVAAIYRFRWPNMTNLRTTDSFVQILIKVISVLVRIDVCGLRWDRNLWGNRSILKMASCWWHMVRRIGKWAEPEVWFTYVFRFPLPTHSYDRGSLWCRS